MAAGSDATSAADGLGAERDALWRGILAHHGATW
jgi:hypothetical protein